MSQTGLDASVSLFEHTWFVLRALQDFLRCPDQTAKAQLNKTLSVWQAEWVRLHAAGDAPHIAAATRRLYERFDGFNRELTDELAWGAYPIDDDIKQRLHYLRATLVPRGDRRDPPWIEEAGEKTPGGTGV